MAAPLFLPKDGKFLIGGQSSANIVGGCCCEIIGMTIHYLTIPWARADGRLSDGGGGRSVEVSAFLPIVPSIPRPRRRTLTLVSKELLDGARMPVCRESRVADQVDVLPLRLIVPLGGVALNQQLDLRAILEEQPHSVSVAPHRGGHQRGYVVVAHVVGVGMVRRVARGQAGPLGPPGPYEALLRAAAALLREDVAGGRVR